MRGVHYLVLLSLLTQSSSRHCYSHGTDSTDATEASTSTSGPSTTSTSSFVGNKRLCYHSTSKCQSSWMKYHSKPSKKGATFAYCSVCGSDFSVGSGGLDDVKCRCKTLKHTRMLKDIGAQLSMSLSLLCGPSRPTLNEQVITAELYFTSFIVEHNLSFYSADHFMELCKVMFPSSEIARNYSSGQTKTKAIITHALAPAANSPVACAKQSFSILCWVLLNPA